MDKQIESKNNMKREIKFRAWSKHHKKMHGNVIYHDEEVTDADPWEYMQFTGLLDKNGKELFEGDLCKDSKGDIIEIGMGTAYAVYINQPLELIGNIYENPQR